MKKYIVILFVLLSMASCRTQQRVVTTTNVVTDTLCLSFCDTTHTVIRHDTTIVTEREYITEHIVTLYDSQTGLPTRQEIERSIRRRADSIVTHRLDSILSALSLYATDSHTDMNQQEVENQPPAFVSKLETLATILVLVIVGYFVCMCVRCLRH